MLAAACLAFPTLLLDPEHLRHRARRLRRRGADLADRLQPARARSASRGTAADRRHRRHRAQAGAADRPAAGLRLPPGRLRRRDRRRVDDPPARRARHRPPTSTASSARAHVDRIVVGLSDRRGRLPIEQLLRAKMSGVRVEDATTTYERLTGKILLDDLKPSWLIFCDGFRASRVTRVRQADARPLVVDHPGVVSAPFMALTAIAIRLDSPGPMLYSQERVGENGARLQDLQVPLDADRRRAWPASRSGRATTTTASPASAASSARRGSTSCRSSGT